MNSNTGHLMKFNDENKLKDFLEMQSEYNEVPDELRKLSNLELGNKTEVYVDKRKKACSGNEKIR